MNYTLLITICLVLPLFAICEGYQNKRIAALEVSQAQCADTVIYKLSESMVPRIRINERVLDALPTVEGE